MGKEKKWPLLSIEDGLGFSRREVRETYREYVNPALVAMMSLVDYDKSFVRAEGARLWDDEGNEYLDFVGGYGSLNLGHNPPVVLEALERIKGYPIFIQSSLSRFAAVLAHNLAALAPGDLRHCFFASTGAETVEGALKLARIVTGRTKIVYCTNSFHGKTMGALSVTGREKYQIPFRPLLPGCEAVPFGDLEALEEALKNKDVAAFITEPIQGEGGIIVPPEGYLKGAGNLCRRYGTLFILDEIQTGLGRTGTMFACEAEGVVPDVLCLAKSLGGGVMPIGVYLTTERLWHKAYGSMERCLMVTNTFGGNAWSTAAAIAAVNEIVRLDLPRQAAEKGRYFLGKLNRLKEKYSLIKDVRGRGLLVGMEFEPPVKGILDKLSGGLVNKLSYEYFGSLIAGELLNRHRIFTVYTLNNPNVIRLEPPLIVSYEELDRVVDAINSIFSDRGFLGIALSGGRTAVSSLFRKS